jgi:hypothetical protein
MREGFREIIEGWTLISGIHDITDKIERAAKWTEVNGPLEPDEESTIKMMIEAQIARGLSLGADDCDDNDYDGDDDMFDCSLGRDGQCGKAGSEECEFECPMRDSEFYAGSKAWIAKHSKRK